MAFYAVKSGRTPGIYVTWKECENQVKGFKGAVFKKFDNKKLAHNFINDKITSSNIKSEQNNHNALPANFKNNKINYVYTDGSCVNNGKKNAKAGMGIFFSEDKHSSISQKLDENIYKQTNNTAELLAIITTIEIINLKFKGEHFVIFTDSKYAILCVGTYGERMNSNNWNGDIKNKELVKKLYNLYNVNENSEFTFIQHIYSHTGNQDEHSLGNEQADRLAYNALT
jgi:ribonuclease HI